MAGKKKDAITPEDRSRIKLAREEWNKISTVTIDSDEAFQQLLSISQPLLAWYKDWSFRYSAFTQMPDAFKEFGFTPKKWKEISDLLPEYNKIKAEEAKEIYDEANLFKKRCELIKKSKAEALKQYEKPEVLILKVNASCLDLKTIVSIYSLPDEATRENRIEEEIKKLQLKLLKDLKEGKFVDPFLMKDYTPFVMTMPEIQ